MDLIPRGFFLDETFNDFLTSKDSDRFKCDIYEKNNKYYIEMDAPGFTKDDLSIECDNGYLTVKVSKKEEKNDETRTYIRKERRMQEYQRTFYMGEVNIEEINASFKDGSLIIEVPKEEKKETKKLIEIK